MIANIDRLNGQTVRVGGYLPECGGYECLLYESQADVLRAKAWFAAAGKEHKMPTYELPDWVGIGGDNDIDRKAAPFVGRYVVITGRADNRCRFHGKWGCTDRGPDIHPGAIEAWQPPSNAAPESKA
jgi:hypothetical protein